MNPLVILLENKMPTNIKHEHCHNILSVVSNYMIINEWNKFNLTHDLISFWISHSNSGMRCSSLVYVVYYVLDKSLTKPKYEACGGFLMGVFISAANSASSASYYIYEYHFLQPAHEHVEGDDERSRWSDGGNEQDVDDDDPICMQQLSIWTQSKIERQAKLSYLLVEHCTIVRLCWTKLRT